MADSTAAPKRLLLSRSSEPAPRRGLQGRPLPGKTLTPPASEPAPRPVSVPSAAAPVPAAVADAPRIPKAATVLVEPMRGELTRPLREVIARRGAKDIAKLFEDLVTHGVSDVHMTRSGTSGTFTIEARVDGKKQLVCAYEGSEAQTIGTLIKTEAKMSTGSNLVPEDGSYPLPINGYPYRARAVALPLFDGGERIVFRLPQIGPVRPLEQIGFTAENLAATKALLDIPGGMTLFAGPTGEGKSTTSLSSLEYLRREDDGVVITLEDPVERVMEGLTQIEVKEEVAGAGFGDMMRYLVRSDSNVLFVGEIRDVKTATAAVEIAKSGRRVVATIHATDNISAFLRLIGMADETPLSVLDAINGVVSQRLVPRLVPGTNRFSGRYPIHEVTRNSDSLTDALVANISRASIRAAAEPTSTSFQKNVDELVTLGVTTLEEARKVVRNV
ncbi:GspE/PulE family protein [Arthrobacter koreensis]|uniref:GspE/PulE family protein n=1 Tax=Arthrobacter koreensis TaxID=199136 RepID=UPI0038015B6D